MELNMNNIYVAYDFFGMLSGARGAPTHLHLYSSHKPALVADFVIKPENGCFKLVKNRRGNKEMIFDTMGAVVGYIQEFYDSGICFDGTTSRGSLASVPDDFGKTITIGTVKEIVDGMVSARKRLYEGTQEVEYVEVKVLLPFNIDNVGIGDILEIGAYNSGRVKDWKTQSCGFDVEMRANVIEIDETKDSTRFTVMTTSGKMRPNLEYRKWRLLKKKVFK